MCLHYAKIFMKEQIGNVILDYSKYPGEDFYSEGVTEDILLDIAKNHDVSEFNHVILSLPAWPFLYHLSHIRGNIIEWLPFDKSQSVLEIGSGCGAITGTLADKAGSVTCIELSKKRSLINAYRNRDKSNVEIKVGNLEDIEQDLEEKFDYIMLIGVFEYAESYIHSESPYDDFLKIMSKHLNVNGKIIIAIENKYGLKYWAGCKEDHVVKYFEGIEDYTETKGVKTFSREGLKKISQENGFHTQFYYPYPDYKLPHVIYSDDYLPKLGELDNNIRNFDGERIVAFNESKVFDGLLKEGMFPFFSNSFLAILSAEDIALSAADKLQTIFSKFSNERADESSIRTDIAMDKEGNKVVRKIALTDLSKQHIIHTYECYKLLEEEYKDSILQPNYCRLISEEGIIELEYLTGITLEEKLDNMLRSGKIEETLEDILRYANLLETMGNKEAFTVTKEFEKIFGIHELKGNHTSFKISNLDLIFTNIIINSQVHVIDYEWTFEFPIPVKFIIFRAVFYYLRGVGKKELLEYTGQLKKTPDAMGVYKMLGIEEEEINAFIKMEHSFQLYMIGGKISLVVAHSLIANVTTNLNGMLERDKHFRKMSTVKVYYDLGDGVRAETQQMLSAVVSDNNRVSVEIPLKKNAKLVRLDPTEFPCVIQVHSVAFNGTLVDRYQTNGLFISPDLFLFNTDDSQILLESIPENADSLHIEYTVEVIQQDFLLKIANMLEILEFEREELEDEIHAILHEIFKSKPDFVTKKRIEAGKMPMPDEDTPFRLIRKKLPEGRCWNKEL